MSSLDNGGDVSCGISCCASLCFAAKLLWLGGIWAMVGPGRCVMLVFLELLYDVTWHRYVKGSFIVIPLQFYPAVQVAIPILGEVVVLLKAFY